jgi:23S rRNA (cytosine1962-C5)-methyltransferase
LQQKPHWIARGGLVDVKSATGTFVGRGYYHPDTDIAIRLLTRDQNEAIDETFLRRRISRALELRTVLAATGTNAYRLINSEGDGLPGLIVDRFAEYLVVQIHTAGMENLIEQILVALQAEVQPRGILLRNDHQSRRREGLAVEEPRVVQGEVPEEIRILENGIQFLVDVWRGQKTGFFLDQREKRAALRKYSLGKRVLNCFSYTGGFSVYAALPGSGSHVTSVDISEPAIEFAKQNFLINKLDPHEHEFLSADVFEYLQAARELNEQFDVVVLDPPAFAKSEKVRSNALKAYRRLNYLGMQVLKPGGILLTCSCSGVIKMDDLLGMVSLAAQQAGREVQLLESFTHDLDHPMNLAMPETGYLKAVFCRIN